MIMTVVAACGDDGGGGGRGGTTTITFMGVNSAETPNTQETIDAINEILEDRLGINIAFQGVDQAAYNITLTGLTGIDLIASADYLSYFDNVNQGAYQPIPREKIRELMPTWYADNADLLVATLVGGQIYAIPNPSVAINMPIAMLRADWFPPGMTEVRNLDDMYEYLSYIQETQPGLMMPWVMCEGTVAWINGAFAFGATHLKAPGGPNCTSPAIFDKRDDPHYVMKPNWAQPTLIPFFEYMKKFADAGFWTHDVLNNPTDMNTAFREGLSGVGWSLNVRAVQSAYELMQQLDPNARIYAYDFGYADNVSVDNFSPMGGAVSIPLNGQNMDDVLRFIELLYVTPELDHLFRYGIEGVNYELNSAGGIIRNATHDFGLGYWVPVLNDDHEFPPAAGFWPGWEELLAERDRRFQLNPFAGFGFDTSSIADIMGNMWDIHMIYGMPLYLGFVDDVNEALAEINRQLDMVGYKTYEDELFRQLQIFFDEVGFSEMGYTISR